VFERVGGREAAAGGGGGGGERENNVAVTSSNCPLGKLDVSDQFSYSNFKSLTVDNWTVDQSGRFASF
jgi:hypothetical protein